MNPAVEVALVASREVKKNFRSVKGILLAVLTIMGGVAFSFVLFGTEKLRQFGEQNQKEMAASIQEAHQQGFAPEQMMAAEQKMAKGQPGSTYGNDALGQTLATEYADALAADPSKGVPLGRGGFSTYCRHEKDSVAFVLNIPGLADFPNKGMQTLVLASWNTAHDVVAKHQELPKGTRVAVASVTSGVYAYVISGPKEQPEASNQVALLPFFRYTPPKPGEPAAEVSPDDVKVTAEDMKKKLTALYKLGGLKNSVAENLASAPLSLVMVLGVSLWLAPLLVSLLGFDGVSSDLQYRAYRFWAIRSRRWSFLVGKFAGLFATVAITTLAMNFIMWIVIAARGEDQFGACAMWGLQLWLRTLPSTAAWMGIVTLISASVRVPILSLLTTFAAFFAVFVIWLIGLKTDVVALQVLCPYGHVTHLLDSKIDQYLIGLLMSLASIGLWVGGAIGIFRWRDV